MIHRKLNTNSYVLGFFILTLSLILGCKTSLTNDRLENIRLPPGFQIELYTEEVPNARAMALAPSGTLFVGSRSAGNVYRVIDLDNDRKADKVFLIANKLRAPAGVAVSGGSLYVSAVNKILRFDKIESRLNAPPAPVAELLRS